MGGTFTSAINTAFTAAVPGIYLGWGGFVIQLGNLIVIITMLVVFVLALLVPLPGGRRRR